MSAARFVLVKLSTDGSEASKQVTRPMGRMVQKARMAKRHGGTKKIQRNLGHSKLLD